MSTGEQSSSRTVAAPAEGNVRPAQSGEGATRPVVPPRQPNVTPAAFNIQPPEAFTFSKPLEWEKWIRRFERFRLASNLNLSSDANQVNTLIYCMGDEADDILRGLVLTEEQRQQYDPVKKAFDKYFVPKKNVIYERAKFNRRVQSGTESVDSFITALYALAQNCDYGLLNDELIRDRLVVGLRDMALSEKMQLDKELTLTKAVTMARQSEAIKKQQCDLRADAQPAKSTIEVDAVMFKNKYMQGKFKPNMQQKKSGSGPKMHSDKPTCHKCGNPAHPKGQCPAKNVVCHTCSKKGHFQKVCRKATSVNAVGFADEEPNGLFLGSVEAGTNPWSVDLEIRNQKVRFKIDTGADVSVIPHQTYTAIMGPDGERALAQTDKPLFGPGGGCLSVAGVTKETLKKGEHTCQEDLYVVRGLHTPLLGRPAITKLGLVARLDTIDTQTLKETYPSLCSGLGRVQQPHTIKLKPDATPYSLSTPRRVPIPLLGKVKDELARMEQMGVISRVEEPTDWCAAMVPVPKKNDKVRICADFTKLNEAVCREKFILPSVEHTLGMLAGARIFSKLDANMGFWQVPLSEESAKLTTFITPFGRFYYNRLPFGITSAPEHFQQRMSLVLEGLPGTVCHIDDVLIWGMSQAEHDERLHNVLGRLRKAGLTLNLDKCELNRSEVNFLGHVISANGVRADPEKISAVQDMREPSNVSELRSFLGMVTQLGKFIPHLAERDKPLRDLLSKKNEWVWGHAQQTAFDFLKQQLTSPPVLALYDPNKELKLSADASSYGLGAVLLQKEEDEWRPVAYASRSLTETEQRYAQVEKEALGLTWGCERFRAFLIGQHFQLETDHKPLVSLLGNQALSELPPRIQRFRMRLMTYSYTIHHVPGKTLLTADTLSRAPVHNSTRASRTASSLMEDTNIYVNSIMCNLPASDTYLAELREQLKADSTCSQVMAMCQSGWPESSALNAVLKQYWKDRAMLTVENGLLLRGTRLVIPSAMRDTVLEKVHEGHQGIVKCRERARETVWWPGLSAQLNELVLHCRPCIKRRNNPAQPLMRSELPDRPWQKLGADMFTLDSTNYLLVVDYYSRYVEIARLTPTRSEDVVVHLKSMFSRHGIPEVLVSDNGPQFSSGHFAQFAVDYSFKHITSSPKFPQSNGEAERHVQTVKNLLKKAKDPYLSLLAYRATPLANGYSPAQLLMGRRLRTTVPQLPSTLLPELPDREKLAATERERRQKDVAVYNKRHRARDLSPLTPGTEVWMADVKAEGTVLSPHAAPRSYLVEGPQGVMRRNRKHLLPLEVTANQQGAPEGPAQAHSPPQQAPPVPPQPPLNSETVTTTRSGREIVKPKRLDL